MLGFHPLHQRRIHPFLLLIVFLISAAGCDNDDDPVSGVPLADISGVVSSRIGGVASRAPVYLGRVPEWFPGSATVVFDSVLADDDGRFEFDQLDRGVYRVFSGVWDRGGTEYFQVSPFSDPLDVSEKGAGHYERLLLRDILREGSVAGEVHYEQTTGQVPADSATVTLHRYQGMNFVPEGETDTDRSGLFLLAGVRTGNYTATAVKVFEPNAPFPLYMSAETEAFFCDGESPVELERMILRDVMVEKPAVYIYPDQAGRFEIGLEFGSGIRLTASEPEYAEGWNVFVDENGRIDDSWDYLFYEIAMPGAPRMPAGWCLPWADLMEGLAAITAELGLNAAETEDFCEYWRTRLPRRDFYELNPVMGDDLDFWVKLKVDPAPQSELRFWLFFRGRDDEVILPPPVIPAFERTGTAVVEWGGAIRS